MKGTLSPLIELLEYSPAKLQVFVLDIREDAPELSEVSGAVSFQNRTSLTDNFGSSETP